MYKKIIEACLPIVLSIIEKAIIENVNKKFK